jgi:hypothetical protein
MLKLHLKKSSLSLTMIILFGLITSCSDDESAQKKEITLLKKVTITLSGAENHFTCNYDKNNRISEWTQEASGVARTYSYVYSTNKVTITSSIDDVIIHNYNDKSQLIGGSL